MEPALKEIGLRVAIDYHFGNAKLFSLDHGREQVHQLFRGEIIEIDVCF
jgi:hypothetical protein